ncbi:opsin-VA-like [Oscarella lobularis]|uniref:opsin-VA-like n=1 Tax=Oscarella lobularis TaxID=121494 RepID=UPI0033139510
MNTTYANATNGTTNNSSISNGASEGLKAGDLIDLVPSPIVFGVAIFVVIVLLRKDRMEAVSNIFIANAAIGDAFSAVVMAMSEYVFRNVRHKAEHVEGICLSYYYFFFFQYVYASWSMAWLSFERYDLIANGLNRRLTKKRAYLIILFIFIMSAVFPSLPFMGWDSYQLEKTDYGRACNTLIFPKSTFDAFYLPSFYVINFLLPLTIVVVCFSLVIRVVVRHIRAKHERRNASEDFNPLQVIKTRAFIIIVTLIVINVVLTTPFVIFTLGAKFEEKKDPAAAEINSCGPNGSASPNHCFKLTPLHSQL